MSEPFIGEIRLVGFNFAPRGWSFCDGQILPIDQNTALFSLLGTTYGGDGRTTFGLPDLRGRTPIHAGRGAGLTSRQLGEKVGVESVDLPAHAHHLPGSNAPASSASPDDKVPAMAWVDGRPLNTFGHTANTSMASTFSAGFGTDPQNNMQPSLAMSFVIALEGIFPSRD